MADTEAQQSAGTLESPDDVKTKAAFVRRWLDAIELSSEEEKGWRKTSEEARQVYEAGEDAPTGTAFNLYYSYIETVCPSLYNSTPVPDIRRRFNDKDPIAKEGADTLERIISYSIDEYDFDDTFGDSVFDLATTGRGVACVVYNAELTEDGSDVGAQSVECETVPWASFRRGPARKWADVPWEAFAHYMDKAGLKKLNPKIDVPMNFVVDKNGTHKEGANQDTPESDIFKRALVWKIWDKDTRTVIFIAPSYPDDVIATVEDPLGLKQFFPTPRPMMTGKASGRLVPLSQYKILKPQINEIENLTKRINKLIKTLRPRGLGPGGVDLDKWAGADDGEIVEVSDVAKWLQEGGAGAMEKLIAWFPMEPTVKAIQELYTRREQAKLEFFEVGGQADIMRGQSNPQETLGAQEKKENWGSLRLKKAQAEVQRFARDLFRLKAEIIAEKFTPANLGVMTGVNLTPPQPPKSQDPQAMQQYQQAQQKFQQEQQKWAQTLKLLKDDKMRGYRIDIETDSTIRGDATRNQQSMAQFVEGTASYFAAVAPVVEVGAVSMTAVVAIYSAFARNFKLGKEVDATLDQLADQAAQAEQQKAAQGPPPNPEEMKAKAEADSIAQKTAKDIELKDAEKNNKAEIQNLEVAHKKELHVQDRLNQDQQHKFAMDTLRADRGAKEIAAKQQDQQHKQTIEAKGKEHGAAMETHKANTKAAQSKAEAPAKQAKAAKDKDDKMSGTLDGLAKAIIAQGKDIKAGMEVLAKASTAKRSVKTPRGEVYTSEAH